MSLDGSFGCGNTQIDWTDRLVPCALSMRPFRWTAINRVRTSRWMR